MAESEEILIDRLRKAVEKNKTISSVTYTLSEYSERVIWLTCHAILEKYDRLDLHDIVYTAVKELIVNATKANLKRVIFTEHHLDPENTAEYEKGLDILKEKLNEAGIKSYRKKFKERDYKVTATFYYTSKVLNVKVKNNFPLMSEEERRVREKFQKAGAYNDLFEFYREHADNSEGAGLGLTMVGILLKESGIDRRSFTLYTKDNYDETASRLEIPLSSDYEPRRERFEREFEESDLPIGKFRELFRQKLHTGR